MEIPQIQIHEAKKKLDEKSCLFVDIRDPGSYGQAHIPGAIHLSDGNVQDFLHNTAKEQNVVVYCYHGNSSMGATAFYIAAHDNPDGAELSMLWHPRPFWKYLAVSILLAIVIGIGLALLIVPGIILFLMFMFSTFIVIERGLGPIDAMSESRRLTRGHKWELLAFVGLLFLINLLGLLALIVGILVSIPVSALAFVHAYRALGGRVEPSPQDAALAG